MGLVCGIDVETTGLDPKKDWVIEVAACHFDSETWELKGKFEAVLAVAKALPLSDLTKSLTGITDGDLVAGLNPFEVFKAVQIFSSPCDYFIAHNAQFDAGMLMDNMERYGFGPSPEMLKKPWLCSKDDIPHTNKKCRTLSHLAVDYGCVVDGSSLHRAMADVLLMGRMLQKIGRTAEQINQWRLEPWVYLAAQVSFQDKDLAKRDGFSWEQCGPHKFPKQWVKRLKQSEVSAEKARDPGFKRLTVTPKE